MGNILQFELAPDVPLQSWPITDWFINYEAGFVRRGLAGQIIKEISTRTPIPPVLLVIFISMSSFLALIYVLKMKIGIEAPFYILFSSLFLGLPVYSNFLFRKDISLVLVLTVSLLVIRRRTYIESVKLCNMLGSFAILVHEAFVFFGLPLIVMSFSNYYFKKSFKLKSLALFSPSILVAVPCFFFRGSSSVASSITNSWNNLLSVKFPNYCCLKNSPASIGAISWSIEQGLSSSRSVLYQFLFGFMPVPFLWFTSFLFAIMFTGKLLFLEVNQRRQFYKITLFQAVMVTPLFALGWDFGRWIFYINTTSIIWCSLFGKEIALNTEFSQTSNIEAFDKSRALVQMLTFGFGIPVCCWSFSGYLISTPLGSCVKSLMNLVTIFTN